MTTRRRYRRVLIPRWKENRDGSRRRLESEWYRKGMGIDTSSFQLKSESGAYRVFALGRTVRCADPWCQISHQ